MLCFSLHLTHITYDLCVFNEVLLHEQSWSIKGVSHLVLSLLSVEHVPNLVCHGLVILVDVAPAGEREGCRGDSVTLSLLKFISQRVATVRHELRGVEMDSGALREALKLD